MIAIWIDGERQAEDAAHVSARDRGLTLADGLFETMRARHGVVFRLEPHLSRLRAGLVRLEIPEPRALQEWVTRAAQSLDVPDASVRLTVTRGIGPGGLLPPADPLPTTVVTVTRLPAFPASVYESGLSAQIATGRFNDRSLTAGLKTLAYTDSVAAILEARRAGAEEAIFVDTEGHCVAASASNLFIVVNGALQTAPLSCGVLPGITRAAVIELASASGLHAVESPFVVDELLAADEAFLTSSLRGVAPLVRVDGRPIGGGRPGRSTQAIMAAYAGLVSGELAAR